MPGLLQLRKTGEIQLGWDRLTMSTLKSFLAHRGVCSLKPGHKINFSVSHLAPKYFKVVANS